MGKKSRHSRQPTTMTMYDHVRELQMRLFVSAIVLAASGTVVYMYYAPILAFLSSPLNAPLYYSSPAGGFAFIMKICLAGGLIITVPVLIYNLIMFIRPAIEKVLPMRRVLLTTLSSTLLAVSGAIFAFYCILPGSLQFFKGFQVSGLNALISADSYLGFVTNIIITFVIVFQIPLLMSFIDKIKPLSPKMLLSMEKWVILGSLIIALLVPFTYDIVTSLLIALPIIVLYNLSIVIVVMQHAKVKRKERKANRSSVGVVQTESEPLLNSFSDELVSFAKIIDTEPNHTNGPGRHVFDMDIKRPRTRYPLSAPAISIPERKPRPSSVNPRMRLISDVRRGPNTNRALASQ